MTRVQTRQVGEYLKAADEAHSRSDLVDALAGGSTLDTVSWWGEAVDPGLQYPAEEGLVEYQTVGDTYRWSHSGTMTATF